MSSHTPILIIGLQPRPEDNKPPWDHETVMKALQSEWKKASDAGFEFVLCTVSPDGSLDEVRETLRGRKWGGVSIGMGVRGNPAFTPLFENLVNACIEEVQPLKMAFPATPTSVFEAVERVLGKAK